MSIQLPLAYFFGAVATLGVILFRIPISKLRTALRILFAFLFSWGAFIVFGLFLPVPATASIAVAMGLIWFLQLRIWLHNLVLLLALISVGLVFGFLLSPWVAVSFMLAIAIYDVLSVRFGYMMWVAKKLSESAVLPAFVIPAKMASWNTNLKEAGFKKLWGNGGEREFSILDGGDIGFPLLMTVSVFFAYGFANAAIIAAFALGGLISAYGIQAFVLKGKPMPALAPIAFASLIGFLIVRFVL